MSYGGYSKSGGYDYSPFKFQFRGRSSAKALIFANTHTDTQKKNRNPPTHTNTSPSSISLRCLYFLQLCMYLMVKQLSGFSGGSVVKNTPANARDRGSIPESGRSPGEGNGNPLQYSCLGNPMNREAWQATVHEVPKSQYI